MSTKTTFKRIALATVATLGFGILSVVPSHAAGMLADSLLNAADGTSTVSSTTAVGVDATAKIVYSAVATSGADTATISGSITSVPATSGAYAVSFAATGGADSADSTSPAGSINVLTNVISTSAGGRVTKYITATFRPDVSGTYTIAIKTAGGINNQTVIWTVTATAIPAATAAASTIDYKSGLDANAYGALCYLTVPYCFGNGGSVVSLDSATATWASESANDPSINAAGAYTYPVTGDTAGKVVGSGLVYFSNKANILTSNTAVAVPMTASISGHGYVRISSPGGDTAYGTTVTETTAKGNTLWSQGTYGQRKAFQVVSDGTPGPATVTISAAGVVLGTVDIVFTGVKASIAPATGKLTKLSKSYIGVLDQATVTINGLDAAGNVLASAGIAKVTSSDPTDTIATATFSGDVVTVTGGAVSGKVTWTVTDDKKNTTTFVTNTVKQKGKFVLTFDAATYGPGEKVTWTITGTDSNGSPVADGVRNAFATLDANMAVATLGVGSLPETSPVFTSGIATGSFYAPATASGTFNITTTIGTSDSGYAAAVAAGTTATKTVSSFSISNAPVDAATDAANQAYDAANAATDAALAAADAADAATSAAQDASDAVAALSATVAKLVASLKAQITSLTNLVIKIQKKVKA